MVNGRNTFKGLDLIFIRSKGACEQQKPIITETDKNTILGDSSKDERKSFKKLHQP